MCMLLSFYLFYSMRQASVLNDVLLFLVVFVGSAFLDLVCFWVIPGSDFNCLFDFLFMISN